MTRNRSRNRRPRRPDDAASTSDAKAPQAIPSDTPAAQPDASRASAVPSPTERQAAPASAAKLSERQATPRKPRPEGEAKTAAPAQEGGNPSRRSSRRRGNRRRSADAPATQSQLAGPTDAVATPQEQRPSRVPYRSRGDQPPGERGQVSHPPAHAVDTATSARGKGNTPQNESRPAAPAGGERRPNAHAQSSAGSANANKRRRGQRRKTSVAPEIMPTEVLKPGISVTPPTRPITMRRLEDLGPEGTITLGCPMLTRTKVALPSSGGVHAPRCNLAWTIRTEEEVSFCLRTPSIAQCWKAHPERLAELLGTTEEKADDEVTAAD